MDFISSGTHRIVKSITIPIPSLKQLDPRTVLLSPIITVRKRSIKCKHRNTQRQEHRSSAHTRPRLVSKSESPNLHPREIEIEDLAKGDDGKVQSWEVMVQKQLALHEVKGEVVESPPQHSHADFVVETAESEVLVIATATLPSQNGETLECDVETDRSGAGPPDERISDEVDLAVVFTPEVDTSPEDWPGWRAGVPGVRFDETGVGSPHDPLQLPELAKEAWVAVIDLLGVFTKFRVNVGFNIPDAVGEGTAFGTGDFLLLETPVWKLDLVREESASGHDVDQSELGLNSAKALFGLLTVRHLLDNLNTEKIVGVSLETCVTICGDLILPVGFGDWWTDIMRVNAAVGVDVVKTNDTAINDPLRVVVVPRKRSGDARVSGGIGGPVDRLSLVLGDENVVLILVRVQSDLLLLTTCRVHVCVRVKVSSLSVVVAQTDTRTKSHICGHICHSL